MRNNNKTFFPTSFFFVASSRYKEQVIEYRSDLESVQNSMSLLQNKYFQMLRRGGSAAAGGGLGKGSGGGGVRGNSLYENEYQEEEVRNFF